MSPSGSREARARSAARSRVSSSTAPSWELSCEDLGEVDHGGDLAHREVADPDRGDPAGPVGPVGADHRGGTAQRVVAVAARDLLEAHPGVVGQRREEGVDGDLVGAQRGLERPEVEVGGLDGAGAGGAGDRDVAAEEQQHDRHLGGGVGVHDRADRGAAVADGRVSDHPQRQRDQRLDPARVGVGLDRRVPRQGPDPDPLRVDPDVVQVGQAVEVDEHAGRGQTHRQQRHQALPTGQHLGVRVGGQGRQRLVEGARPDVREGGWLHRTLVTSPAPSSSLRPLTRWK